MAQTITHWKKIKEFKGLFFCPVEYLYLNSILTVRTQTLNGVEVKKEIYRKKLNKENLKQIAIDLTIDDKIIWN